LSLPIPLVFSWAVLALNSTTRTMSSSIAIPAGPSANRSFHKGTGSSTNSPFGTSPSSSPPSAGKDKALHNRRPSLLSK
jgi:hypothetical protein